MARRGTSIGNTPGGRGAIGTNIRSQADYYRSGRSSALNPGAMVRSQDGTVLSGKSSS